MRFNKSYKLKNFKGVSFSLPPLIRRMSSEDQIHFKITFNESYIYDFGDTDFLNLEQLDFNKLIGFKLNFFKPMKNSIMIGSRYYDNQLQLSYYTHDSNGNNYFSEIPLITLSEDDLKTKKSVNILFDFKEGLIKLKTDNQHNIFNIKSHVPEMENTLLQMNSKKLWLITHWFGGTQRPPQKITLDLMKLDPTKF